MRFSPILVVLCATTLHAAAAPVIWSDRTPSAWHDGLPLGNGNIAAMVLGTPDRTRVALTHFSLHRKNADARPVSSDFARLVPHPALFGRQLPEAHQLLPRHSANLSKIDNPLPAFANLFLDFDEHTTAEKYRRELNLLDAIAQIRYQLGAVIHTQTFFTSAADQVIVVMLAADKPGQLSGVARLARAADPECTLLYDSPRRDGMAEFGFAARCENGLRLAARARARIQGGKWEPVSDPVQGAGLRFDKADRVTIWIALEAQNGTDGRELLPPRLASADDRRDALIQDHIQAHRRLFDRCSLSLGGPDRSSLPTEQRLKALQSGAADPGLESLLFQFDRYLAIAAFPTDSTLPASRQGPWNAALPAATAASNRVPLDQLFRDLANLAECQAPIMNRLDPLVRPARLIAQFSGHEWKFSNSAWSRLAAMRCWTSQGNGDKAEEQLRWLLAESTADNLFVLEPRGNIRMDMNLRSASAIADMLLTEQDGKLCPLPALPSAWPEGEIRGFRAGDNLDVDLRWKNGKLAEMIVRSLEEQELRIKLPNGVTLLKTEANQKPLPVTDGVATVRIVVGATRVFAE